MLGDGRMAFVPAGSSSTAVWDLVANRKIGVLPFRISSAARELCEGNLLLYTTDERLIRIRQADGTFKLVELGSVGSSAPPRKVYLSPNGKIAWVMHELGIYAWNIETEKREGALDFAGEIGLLGFPGKSGHVFLFAAQQGTGGVVKHPSTAQPFVFLYCWRNFERQPTPIRLGNPGSRVSLGATGDCSIIASTNSDGSILIQSIDGSYSNTTATGEEVSAIVSSDDGRLIVAGTRHGQLMIINPRTSEIVRQLRAHTSEILGLSLSDDGRTLLTMDSGGETKLWSSKR